MDVEVKSNETPDTEIEVEERIEQAPPPEKQENQESQRTSRKLLYWTCVVSSAVVVAVVLGACLLYITDKDEIKGIAVCGDCHCSYADSKEQTCPEKPPTEFSEEFLESLLDIKPLYPLPTLDCDPYQDDECETTFSRSTMDFESVCAIHYLRTGNSSPKMCNSYWMVSYPDATAAEAAGAFVTHRGPCGLCSSLQDLVVYMRYHDLTTLGQECGVKGLTISENGEECFQKKLGMTEGRSAI